MLKFSNVRLLVKDYAKCFEFYSNQLGLEVAWGSADSGYASFKVTEGIEGFAIYPSDAMAEAIGNADKALPVGCREKSLISFSVESVDAIFKELLAKGVEFINVPTDMPGWGIRVVHLRDPEGNLIELFSPLSTEHWDKELIEENKKYL